MCVFAVIQPNWCFSVRNSVICFVDEEIGFSNIVGVNNSGMLEESFEKKLLDSFLRCPRRVRSWWGIQQFEFQVSLKCNIEFRRVSCRCFGYEKLVFLHCESRVEVSCSVKSKLYFIITLSYSIEWNPKYIWTFTFIGFLKIGKNCQRCAYFAAVVYE